MIRAVLFDFDGTLADSFAAITASTNHVRQIYGLPPLPEADVRSYVGHGLEQLMRDLVPAAPTPADAVLAYRTHHETVAIPLTTLMPGVAETVALLHRRGYALGVCSNKAVRFTRRLVDHFFPANPFGTVLGPDDVGRPKPDPAMLQEACRRLNVSESNSVYVGDMSVDVQTAKAAGMPVWIVPGGAADVAVAAAAGPDLVLADFAALGPLLPELTSSTS